MREGAVFEFIAQLIHRQFRFHLAIIVIGVVGIIYANGWSWTSAVVALLALILIPLAWALVAFWVYVFSNTGRTENRR